MAGLHGVTVKLYNRAVVTYDELNAPVYSFTCTEVDNVLPGQPSTSDIVESVDLSGKRADCVLGIPKGDTHDWEDQIVEFFGHRFRTFGIPVQGIEANIPLSWHKKVRCERYE